jgi:hypothetical protein
VFSLKGVGVGTEETPALRLIGLFPYIKIITSIRGCEAETRETSSDPQGNKKIFLWCSAAHSFIASK